MNFSDEQSVLLLHGATGGPMSQTQWSIGQWYPGLTPIYWLSRATTSHQPNVIIGGGINEHEALMLGSGYATPTVQERAQPGSDMESTGKRRDTFWYSHGRQGVRLGMALAIELSSGRIVESADEIGLVVTDPTGVWQARFDRATTTTTLIELARKPLASIDGFMPRMFDDTGRALLLSNARQVRVLQLDDMDIIKDVQLPMGSFEGITIWNIGRRCLSIDVGVWSTAGWSHYDCCRQ